MALPDLYNTLGVARSASTDEIRRAYRAKARQLHPDVNKAPDAQKKFGDIQYAHEVLTDPQKRSLYDQYGHDGLQSGFVAPGAQRPNGPASARNNPFEAEDLEEVFATYFGGRAGSGGRASRSSRPGRAKARRAKPEPVTIETPIAFLTACRGGTEHLRLTIDGRAKTLEVMIPSGVVDGSQLRVRDVEGGDSPDIILLLRVGVHPLFRRTQDPHTKPVAGEVDLYLDVPLTFAEAALGATVMVPTLAAPVEVRIPAGTASGKLLRLRGRGIRTSERTGDMYVVVRIEPPTDMTESERRALESVSKRQTPPRGGAEWNS